MQKDSKPQAEEFAPCRYMEQWLDALANGSLTGFARWYTEIHVTACKQCQAALEAMLQLRARLQSFREAGEAALPSALTSEKRLSLEAALEAVEKKRT